MPVGRRQHAEQVTTHRAGPPSEEQPVSAYCRKSHSRWCPRKWISSMRPCPHTPDGGGGADKETVGEEQWHEGQAAKVESGVGGGGWDSLVCLLVCICAFVCSMRASAKFTGLSTLIISTHWCNNGPDPMCNTSHLNENFTFCVKQSCTNTQACFCFVFKAAEVTQTEGEDALGTARKRVCYWTLLYLHNK